MSEMKFNIIYIDEMSLDKMVLDRVIKIALIITMDK